MNNTAGHYIVWILIVFVSTLILMFVDDVIKDKVKSGFGRKEDVHKGMVIMK